MFFHLRTLAVSRHGICHGHTNIIRVKLSFNRVKFCSEHSFFVVSSPLFEMFSSFLLFPTFSPFLLFVLHFHYKKGCLDSALLLSFPYFFLNYPYFAYFSSQKRLSGSCASRSWDTFHYVSYFPNLIFLIIPCQTGCLEPVLQAHL